MQPSRFELDLDVDRARPRGPATSQPSPPKPPTSRTPLARTFAERAPPTTRAGQKAGNARRSHPPPSRSRSHMPRSARAAAPPLEPPTVGPRRQRTASCYAPRGPGISATAPRPGAGKSVGRPAPALQPSTCMCGSATTPSPPNQRSPELWRRYCGHPDRKRRNCWCCCCSLQCRHCSAKWRRHQKGHFHQKVGCAFASPSSRRRSRAHQTAEQ
mmetsp:Transcript_93618/g.303018  ORF Transcript_93618/g.303018 Transcript_93618/m.303018 type:complete len:214 (-) Transcript_93618:78-719(-)